MGENFKSQWIAYVNHLKKKKSPSVFRLQTYKNYGPIQIEGNPVFK